MVDGTVSFSCIVTGLRYRLAGVAKDSVSVADNGPVVVGCTQNVVV
jgi:hypothetical protein